MNCERSHYKKEKKQSIRVAVAASSLRLLGLLACPGDDIVLMATSASTAVIQGDKADKYAVMPEKIRLIYIDNNSKAKNKKA